MTSKIYICKNMSTKTKWYTSLRVPWLQQDWSEWVKLGKHCSITFFPQPANRGEGKLELEEKSGQEM